MTSPMPATDSTPATVHPLTTHPPTKLVHDDLTLAHVAARGLEDPSDAWKVFAVASFFAFGLTLRALSTGLGLP